MRASLRTVCTILLVAAMLGLAGCAEPGGTDDEPAPEDQETMTDNEGGANPANPQNGTAVNESQPSTETDDGVATETPIGGEANDTAGGEANETSDDDVETVAEG